MPDDGPQCRERIIDPFTGKIEEWVERSEGKIRAGIGRLYRDRSWVRQAEIDNGVKPG